MTNFISAPPPCRFMYVDEDPNVINMSLNVHDNSQNDALATIDPDVHIRRFTNCQFINSLLVHIRRL